jgi:trigger factor
MSSQTHPVEAQVEETGPCSRNLKIKVPQARVDAEIESTFRTVEKNVAFPGFRAGRAPRKMVEAKLGGQVLSEVKERLVQAAVDEVIDAHKLQAVGSPRMEWEKAVLARGQDFAFEIGIDVRPTFALPDLAAITVQRPDLTVKDEAVDREVESLRESRATVADAGDEPLRDRGIVALHVRIDVGGETVVDAGDVEWQAGSDMLGGMEIAGLSASLVGKKKGESAEFTQKLPDDFKDEAHRGKDAKVTLTLENVQHVTLPEVNDEFAKEMDYDGVEDMRKELRKKLERQAEQNKDAALDGAIVEALLAAVAFEVPPSLVAAETERMLRRYEAQFRRQGVPEQDIEVQLRQLLGAAAQRVKRDLRSSFLLDRIATERKVFVTENEMRQEIARIGQRYDRTPAEMETILERQGVLPALRAELRERKTVAEIRGIVKVVESPAEAPKSS